MFPVGRILGTGGFSNSTPRNQNAPLRFENTGLASSHCRGAAADSAGVGAGKGWEPWREGCKDEAASLPPVTSHVGMRWTGRQVYCLCNAIPQGAGELAGWTDGRPYRPRVIQTYCCSQGLVGRACWAQLLPLEMGPAECSTLRHCQ